MVNTSSFVDGVNAKQGVVTRNIFYDQEIYKQELEQVFGRSWLVVGHESQVAKPNDFAANYMGEDPILLTRDAKGKLHTFLNMCRHRGNRICRADAGNAPSFMCTYHGWTFATDGKLVGVPGYKEAYFEELDRSQWGLVEARTESYKGLTFANWDKEAPGLVDYLGDAAWYMDLWLDRTAGSTEILPGIHRWVMNFNWKFGSDNFGGDNYHTLVTHGSMSASGMSAPRRPLQLEKTNFIIAAGNGHCVLGGYAGDQPRQQQGFNEPEVAKYLNDISAELNQRLGKIRGKQANMGIGTLFPNFTWHSSPTIRMWHPRGPWSTEVWSFCIVDKNAPDVVKQAMKNSYIQRFGPAGNMEQDDANNWMDSTRSAKSLTARKYPLNMTMGKGHEWTNETHPGQSLGFSWSESNWRHFYGWWAKMMDAPSWKQLPLDPRHDR